MAKRPKKSAAVERAPEGVDASDLKRVIEEASRQKALASQYSGNHGAVIKNAVERYGLNKDALTVCRRMKDMEERKRDAFMRSLIEYAWKLGFFDQVDAFDDTVDTMRAIVASAEKSDRPAPRGDGVADAILN